MATDDLWVLEWHQESNNIHVQRLAGLVGLNRARFEVDASPGPKYVPVCVGTKEQVEAEAEKIRPILIAREKARTAP